MAERISVDHPAMMKRKRTYRIGKYTFEFLSIFIAVISAFALNNWNDNRRDRLAENKILTEIYNGLENDLNDVRANSQGHSSGLQAVTFFMDVLANNTAQTDSFLIHYFNLTRDFISIQNTSGYETLQSKGLELIRNDALRTAIISLYEYDYTTLKKLEEEYYELQFQENYFHVINAILSEYLLVNDHKQITGISIPLELDQQEEKLLLTCLWKIQANRMFILRYYTEIETRIIQVRGSIKAELE
ncbi:MAG: hypothetical protein R2767_11645 [Chitinophagales bacterium]|nr:hypothetical protein [Chitinophagales bacterium]HPE98689.1 hypothetical protein [Chitinophagales bacterium]HPR30148.1 hypothetical protein [Chitinophagales bacterium]HQU77060.1 hypothetical protein [Chitinophagales bacterium]HRX24823.1 hypothetical protein [Chitinophagales bacterium]